MHNQTWLWPFLAGMLAGAQLAIAFCYAVRRGPRRDRTDTAK